jgi:hypothetical protein
VGSLLLSKRAFLNKEVATRERPSLGNPRYKTIDLDGYLHGIATRILDPHGMSVLVLQAEKESKRLGSEGL